MRRRKKMPEVDSPETLRGYLEEWLPRKLCFASDQLSCYIASLGPYLNALFDVWKPKREFFGLVAWSPWTHNRVVMTFTDGELIVYDQGDEQVIWIPDDESITCLDAVELVYRLLMIAWKGGDGNGHRD
jgi:hypothetical protein